MKHVKEHKYQAKLRHCNIDKVAYIYVDEYATIWAISARILGYALCTAQDWRYSKKQYKTVDEAARAFQEEYNNHPNFR